MMMVFAEVIALEIHALIVQLMIIQTDHLSWNQVPVGWLRPFTTIMMIMIRLSSSWQNVFQQPSRLVKFGRFAKFFARIADIPIGYYGLVTDWQENAYHPSLIRLSWWWHSFSMDNPMNGETTMHIDLSIVLVSIDKWMNEWMAFISFAKNKSW